MDSKYPKIMAQWSLRAILVSLALASILLSSGCNEQSSSSSFGLEEEACPLPKYDRYGDYLSAQMVTNRSFGYGMFVCEFQAADAPVCSTFWLYANEPATKNLPDVAQNWRWNEIDFEFVPYTQATQSQYYTFNGGLPNPTVKAYGTTLNFGDPRAQSLANAAVTWTPGKFQTDETIAKDMWAYYNAFMAGGNNGGPSGGTFTLQDGQSGDTTNALSWSISAGDMQNALDGLNKGTGLFGLKGKYNVSIPAAGGPGDIQADSLNVIRNMDAGLVPQLAPGQIVTCVTNATIIPSGTTITGVDTSAKTVTLSQKATAAISRATFNFQASGVWAVNFTPAIESASALLII
ncbi:MAG: hypothetical protein EOM25_06790, partial [Deltaproteobacteria bacterium]|nr:hypothetical protein [Deltaproteobacteria bacterium]